jgi:hypothetical protein
MNVVSLPDTIVGSSNARFVNAWLGWRGDRLLPARSAVDLRAIARDLPGIGIAEVRSADDIRVRIAGTGLQQLYGMELTGRNLREVTADADWPMRSARYLTMVERPCGAFYRRRDTLPNGRQMEYEAVQLPLLPDRADGPRQVIWSAVPVDKSFGPQSPDGPRAIPLATRYSFVDIGAGVPAAPMSA